MPPAPWRDITCNSHLCLANVLSWCVFKPAHFPFRARLSWLLLSAFALFVLEPDACVTVVSTDFLDLPATCPILPDSARPPL